MDVSRTEQQEVVDRFVRAVMTGDVQGLLDVLAPDVVLLADGGGVAKAFLKPLTGARPIANLLSKFTQLVPGAQVANVWVNGGPAARIDGGEEGGETVISVAVEDGRITHIFAMRNPHKLARLDEAVDPRR
jgi:RNA polymerase sigma-70 factor (ECF subfamily)